MIDNSRFLKNEKKSGLIASKNLSYDKNIFVMNAFASSHRKHASTYGVKKFIKEKYMGFLLEKELSINRYIVKNRKLLTLILGGSKIKNKISSIERCISKKLVRYMLFGSNLSNIINSNKSFFFFC